MVNNIDQRLKEAKALNPKQGLKLYAKMVIGENRIEHFEKWAFGKMPDQTREIPALWNKKHSGELKVSGDDNLIETFDKMLRIYEANTEKPK